MYFIGHHVVELLVVHNPYEYIRHKPLAGYAAVHHLLPIPLISQLEEELSEILLLDPLKGRGVYQLTRGGSHFSSHALQQLRHRHAGRQGVRVHDYVRHDALLGKRHVLMSKQHAHDALLAVARSELIAELRDPQLPQPHLDQLVAFRRLRDDHPIYYALLAASHGYGGVSPLLQDALGLQRGVEPRRRGLADYNFTTAHIRLRRRDAVFVKVAVCLRPPVPLHGAVGYLNPILLPSWVLLLLGLVGTIKHRPKHAALHRRLVQNHGVFYVVARIRQEGHNGVLASRSLGVANQLQPPRSHYGPFGVVQHVAAGVQLVEEVGLRQA